MAKRSTRLVNAPEKTTPENVINPLDPYNITPRLQKWISELIEMREDMDARTQVSAISAIGRLQVMFIKLREEGGGGVATGTEVKRFEQYFKTNAKSRRKGVAGKSTAAVAALEHDDESDMD